MAESGSGDQVDISRFQNQNLQESTGGRQFRYRKASSPIWAPLKRKKASRGNPKAAIAARWQASKTTRKFRRSQAATVEDATKELVALAAHTPDNSDADTRKPALRMYYVELAHGISPRDAQTNVGQVFLISPITVLRTKLPRCLAVSPSRSNCCLGVTSRCFLSLQRCPNRRRCFPVSELSSACGLLQVLVLKRTVVDSTSKYR